MEFEIQHTHPVDAETYWKIFFDPDYNRRVYIDTLRFQRAEVVSQHTDEAGRVHRTMLLEPEAEAPAVIQKLMGSAFHYLDEGVFDPSTNVWTYRAKPSKLSDKIVVQGTVRTKPNAGTPGIVRVTNGVVRVQIFGVGGVVEKFLEQSTRTSYDKIARVTDDYIREHRLSAG